MATTPYAVTADLVSYMPAGTAPADPDATRQIQRACELVDWALRGCAYDVDTNGNPTDITGVVQAALKSAVCAQVVWWLSNGDEIGETRDYMLTTVEGVTLNRGPHRPPRLAPDALNALEVAGLKSTLFPIHLP